MNGEKTEVSKKGPDWMVGDVIEPKKDTFTIGKDLEEAAKVVKKHIDTHAETDIETFTSNQARKALWKDVCNEYLEAFCLKHDYTYDNYVWVGDDPGTVANIGDLFVSMDDIRYDIDNNIPENYFEKWYWKNLEVYELTGCNYMNYSSYCMGAPDNWPDERLDRVREAKKRLEVAQKEFEEEMERIKNEKPF